MILEIALAGSRGPPSLLDLYPLTHAVGGVFAVGKQGVEDGGARVPRPSSSSPGEGVVGHRRDGVGIAAVDLGAEGLGELGPACR